MNKVFQKIDKIDSRLAQPVMVWDGNCGFCKYWIIRWKRLSRDKIQYLPFQESAAQFPQIDLHHFKEAVRLIDVDGRVYSGPEAAYKSLSISGKYPFLLKWYQKMMLFRLMSDLGYQFIANHRDAAMRLTQWLFGNNPIHLKKYWLFYLMLLFGLLIAVV